jgi:hypothetical protein
MARPKRRPFQGSCEHCGRAIWLRYTTRVPVKPQRPDVPDVGELFWCEPCVKVQDRTWRRRWSPLDTI